MQIIYTVGDAIATDAAFLVQGCNAQGVMGSGIAKSIRVVYPKVFDEYRSQYEHSGLSTGQIVPVFVDSTNYNGHIVGERVIFNGITQEFFGRDPNVVYVDYDAISKVFRSINMLLSSQPRYLEFARQNGYKIGNQPNPFPVVALPLIGAGLANGKWPEIAQRIEAEAINFQPMVYVENQAKLDSIRVEIANASVACDMHPILDLEQDRRDFMADLEKAAQSSDASDEWIAGFARQFFRK